jgi:hypothetical protein
MSDPVASAGLSEPIDRWKLGLALVIAGAVGVVISDFLPLVSSTTFGRVAENTAVQHDGWLYLICAGLVVMAALRPGMMRLSWPVGVSAVVLLAAIYFGLISESQRTLYAIGLNGQPLARSREVAAPGVGAYAMVVSAIVLLIGAVILHEFVRAARKAAWLSPAGPRPEVSETVDGAVTLFRTGFILDAAKMLRKIRMEARSHSDRQREVEVDKLAGEMRSQLDGKERSLFEDHLRLREVKHRRPKIAWFVRR